MSTPSGKKTLLKWMWVILLLAAWEAAARSGHISPLILPPVEDVLGALAKGITQGRLLAQTFFSLTLIAAGLLVSVVLALLLSFLSGVHTAFQALAEVLCTIAHPLPGLALMPLIILWFGTGVRAVFAIIVHAALWPLLLQLMTGLSRTPEIYTDAGKTLSMSDAEIFFDIRLRYATPELIGGLKTGWARAWRAFIGAEMVFGAVGAYGGLGSYLLSRRTFMDTAGLFAGIVIVVVIGILVEYVFFAQWEKRTVDRWGLRR